MLRHHSALSARVPDRPRPGFFQVMRQGRQTWKMRRRPDLPNSPRQPALWSSELRWCLARWRARRTRRGFHPREVGLISSESPLENVDATSGCDQPMQAREPRPARTTSRACLRAKRASEDAHGGSYTRQAQPSMVLGSGCAYITLVVGDRQEIDGAHLHAFNCGPCERFMVIRASARFIGKCMKHAIDACAISLLSINARQTVFRTFDEVHGSWESSLETTGDFLYFATFTRSM